MINGTKLTRENNSLIYNNKSNYIAHNLRKRSSCLFQNNFRETGTPNAVYEEIIRLHIFIDSRQEYSSKGAHL